MMRLYGLAEGKGFGGMIRQPRSEVTRRKILDAATELFSTVGYAGTGLGDIVERVDVTKGGLYHHFDSKEALALAIIGESAMAVRDTFRRSGESSPALESMIRGVFAVAELLATDRAARTGLQLMQAFARLNEEAANPYRMWVAEMSVHARNAQAAGDLRADCDPESVGEFLVSAFVGVELVSTAVSGGVDVVEGVVRAWELLLPAMVPEESVSYFRAFVVRQSRRQRPSSPATD